MRIKKLVVTKVGKELETWVGPYLRRKDSLESYWSLGRNMSLVNRGKIGTKGKFETRTKGGKQELRSHYHWSNTLTYLEGAMDQSLVQINDDALFGLIFWLSGGQ